MEEQSVSSLGNYLKSEREKKQITIEQIASATKINLRLLHALEEDDYDLLPAKPFIRGFIKSYLKYLNLDAAHILVQFDSFLDQKNSNKLKHPIKAPHIFVGKGKQGDSSKTILGIIMGLFLLIAILVFTVLKPSLRHRRIKEKISTQETTQTSLFSTLKQSQPALTEEAVEELNSLPITSIPTPQPPPPKQKLPLTQEKDKPFMTLDKTSP